MIHLNNFAVQLLLEFLLVDLLHEVKCLQIHRKFYWKGIGLVWFFQLRIFLGSYKVKLTGLASASELLLAKKFLIAVTGPILVQYTIFYRNKHF